MTEPTETPAPASPAAPSARAGSLLERPWIQALALVLLVLVAYGPALEGELVWDDEKVIGAAAALDGPVDAFRSNLFASLPGQGAKYYRPLTSISYWLDVKAFQVAPHVGMHIVNLAWHAVASILMLRFLRRLAPPTSGAGAAVCFGVAALWAVSPLKAENVAWITGRGDVMGLVFILLGLEIAARVARPWARAVAVTTCFALALLCKEAMIGGAAIVLADTLVATGSEDREPAVRHVGRALLAPQVLGVLLASAAYLVLRKIYLPVTSGGERNFSDITRFDAVALFFETTGVAVVTLATSWRARLLRSPIGFDASWHLVHDEPATAILGVGVWVAAALLAWRVPKARAPLACALGAFLPVSNLVGMHLESRMSDRFLYLPTVGIALAAVIAGRELSFRYVRIAGSAAIAVAVLVLLPTRKRAAEFVSSDALFSAEVARGNRALAVLDNAAFAAARAKRYDEARDLHVALSRRFVELGITGAAFDPLVGAIRWQVRQTGDAFPPAAESYETLLRVLIDGREEVVTLRFANGLAVDVEGGSDPARRHYRKYGAEIRTELALLLATRGDPAGLAMAKTEVDGCPRCASVLLDASEVAHAVGDVDDAERWASTAGATPEQGDYLERIRFQRRVLASASPLRDAFALFIGGGFRPACAAGVAEPSLANASTEAVAVVASACWLAPEPGRAAALVGDDRARLRKLAGAAEPLRTSPAARVEMVSAALRER